MTSLLEKQVTAFKAKAAERDALLAKSDVTQEDIVNAKKMNEELVAMKSLIDDINKIDSDRKALDQFMNDPATSLNLGTKGITDAEVLGNAKGAGHVTVSQNKKGDLDLFDEAEGTISEKQAKAISEKEYKRAFRKWTKVHGDLNLMSSDERKTLQEGIDDQGGYLVPTEMMNRMIEKTAAPTRVNGLVTTLNCNRDALSMPKVNYSTDDIYTTGIRAVLTGEIPASSTTHRVTDPVFGQLRIDIGTWMLSMPLTNDMIEDTDFPILGWCAGKFGETIDLLKDNQIINGTGVGVNPHGILKNPGGTNEPAVVLSATANNIDAAQLRSIPFQVPEQYINERTRWVFNRTNCGGYIASLQTTNGEFLFSFGKQDSGLVTRTPDTLAGYPIAYNAFMPNRGDGAFPMIFGDLGGYFLANRVGLSVRILNELYAETNQVLMLGRLRFGGKVAEPWRMVIGKSDNA